MQKNPGAKTIEGDFEEALFLSGAVPEQDRGCPKRFDWARSARTDKGVSAVGQVVSGRFYIDPPGLVERINLVLPAKIRVFGYKRVTATFNAKKFCDRRRYVYLIPVFALDPSSHPDRESVLASLGSGNELVKCLECSERGRKVEGVMGRRGLEPRDGEIQVTVGFGNSSNSLGAVLETVVGEDIGVINSNIANFQHHKEKGDATDSSIHENGGLRIESEPVISSNNGPAILRTEIDGETMVVNDDDVNCDRHKDKAEAMDSDIPKILDVEIGTQTHSAVLEIGTCDDNSNFDPDTVKSGGIETDIPQNVGFGTGTTTGMSLNNGCVLSCSEVAEVNGVISKEIDNGDLNFEQLNKNEVGNDVGVKGEEGMAKRSGFRYGDKEKERFNGILKSYVGTHNFHNFTTRIKAEDPSARRYIISFEANTVVNVDGIDFVKCEVVGQSFMLHQIRKMIGVAVAIMRNCADESLIERAFQQDLNINVPTAPEVGLYLDECFFTSYNQKWKDTHEEVSMKAYADEAEEFKMKHIYSHIASTEHKEGSVALWLHSLNHRNYPDLRIGSNGGCSEEKCDEPNFCEVSSNVDSHQSLFLLELI